MQSSSFVEPVLQPRQGLACGVDAAPAAELGYKIGFHFRARLPQIVRGHEAASQPEAVTDRHRRDAMKRPALGKKRRWGFDQYRLDGDPRALRGEGHSSLETIDRRAHRAGSFRKKQELPAGPEVLHPPPCRSEKNILAYLARQPCRRPPNRIVDPA